MIRLALIGWLAAWLCSGCAATYPLPTKPTLRLARVGAIAPPKDGVWILPRGQISTLPIQMACVVTPDQPRSNAGCVGQLRFDFGGQRGFRLIGAAPCNHSDYQAVCPVELPPGSTLEMTLQMAVADDTVGNNTMDITASGNFGFEPVHFDLIETGFRFQVGAAQLSVLFSLNSPQPQLVTIPLTVINPTHLALDAVSLDEEIPASVNASLAGLPSDAFCQLTGMPPNPQRLHCEWGAMQANDSRTVYFNLRPSRYGVLGTYPMPIAGRYVEHETGINRQFRGTGQVVLVNGRTLGIQEVPGIAEVGDTVQVPVRFITLFGAPNSLYWTQIYSDGLRILDVRPEARSSSMRCRYDDHQVECTQPTFGGPGGNTGADATVTVKVVAAGTQTSSLAWDAVGTMPPQFCYTSNLRISTSSPRNDARPESRPGADRDAHGCIPSAGYVWSETEQDCVRPWRNRQSKP